MDVELDALIAFVPVEVGEEANQPHRQGREEERRADNRPDRDVFGALAYVQQGDDRDQRLRHRRADRGEDAAHGPHSNLEPMADPLDRVGKEQRASEDDGEADEEDRRTSIGAVDVAY